MQANHENQYDSLATLVAVMVAARRAGSRELEREARAKLETRHGIKLTSTRKRKGGQRAE